ncbi:MAG TPA: inositol monophosphatase [Parvularculaceae bacterium]|nr:inositol monophosphatase [Caulobacterales bacterium]HPE32593.1 inositol monophosphatase [Parvularculaceae bacterium]
MIVDVEKVAALIAEIAQTEIMPRYGKLSAGEIRQKSGPNDLVTEVDEATERALELALRAIRPDAGFIGEELAAKNPQAANALTGEGAFWVVDPLDGTRNFVNGVDEFGTIVALVENGETRAGWIYAAPHNSSAIAEKGEGATWRGERLRVTASEREKPLGLRSLGWLSPDRQERMRARLSARFESRSSHCSAYAYIALAKGDVDFKVSSLIHPWDHVAGALIVSEAGGKPAFLDDGEPYRPSPSVNKPLLVTARRNDWDAIAAGLRD